MDTRPQPPQTNFIVASLSLHMWVGFTSGVPQKLHFLASPQGLHKWPGSFATAPQLLHVWAMMDLLFRFGYLTLIWPQKVAKSTKKIRISGLAISMNYNE
jgi:hypothetical protein